MTRSIVLGAHFGMSDGRGKRVRVLLVDDDVEMARPLIRMLERDAYDVVYARSVVGALDILGGEHERFDHAVVDLNLGAHDGQDVLAVTERLAYRLPVIMLVAPERLDCRRAVALRGRCSWLPKPVAIESLLETMRWGVCVTLPGYGSRYGLSEHELLTVQLSFEDKTDDEIAAELGCGISTVRKYWERALLKVGVPSREALKNDVVRWLSRGSVRPQRGSGVYRARGPRTERPANGPARAGAHPVTRRGL